MKHFCLILICSLSVSYATAQCPPNLDFEQGNYSGWEYSKGSVAVVNGVNVITLTPGPPQPGRHELITPANAGRDPYGNFPTLCPYGGNYSIKLGNSGSGAEAEGISYTFTVPTVVDTFTFTFFYAVVFEDPRHREEEQPRFFATAYDVLSGELINCASYNFVSTSGIPGFETSTVGADVLYKNWSPVSIQFANMANRQVRLEFKTADCTLGGHFGYAYVDVGTQCSNILATAPYCIETNSVILNAPYGFGSYTWYNSDYTAVLGTGQSLTLSPPPAVDELFHVDMIPYPGFGCRDTAYATVKPEPVPDTPVAVSIVKYCQFASSTKLQAEALPNHELLWYTTPTGGTPTNIAPTPSTATAGTFTWYVSQKKLFGCESLRKKIEVVVTRTPVTSFIVNDLTQCQNGNQFVFDNTSTNLENSTYKWEFGDAQTSTDADPTHTYQNGGVFTVRLTVYNSPECFDDATTQVKVIAKPTAAFSYPSIICEKQTPVTLTDNSSVPFNASTISSWWWNIDGSIVNTQTPAPFILNNAGTADIRLVVETPEGCRSDTTKHTLTVHHRPVAAFTYSSPLCNNETMQFMNLSSIPGAASSEFISLWDWHFDNGTTSVSQHPLQLLTAGAHQAQLIAQSNFGCRSLVADSTFIVHAKPEVGVNVNDSCVLVRINYTALDLSNTVARWYWDFGGGLYNAPATHTKTFYTAGPNSFTLIGQTIQGCKDTLIRQFIIYDNKSFAGNDTLVAKDQPVQLNANGGPAVQYTWSPAIGLNDTGIENPVATYDEDQRYHLYSISDKGCVAESDIVIKRYKGPDIYIPTAFTPNGDGLNDIVTVLPVGIKAFKYFRIYNRQGQIIFHTTDYTRGWNGTYKGMLLDTQVFVFVAEAIDYTGKPMLKKGTLTLIR